MKFTTPNLHKLYLEKKYTLNLQNNENNGEWWTNSL